MTGPQPRRFTKSEHYRAVALVLAGCPKRGVAVLTGIERPQLRRLLASATIEAAVEREGGTASFVARHAHPEDVAALQRRWATQKSTSTRA